jgi:hypothetical protein
LTVTAVEVVTPEQAGQFDEPDGFALHSLPVGGPVWVAWREGTLTRAKELESLCAWMSRHPDASGRSADLSKAIHQHLAAARDAAKRRRRLRPVKGALIERAISNLDAAEANLLQLATAGYLAGQMPSLLNQVQRHLPAADPRRQAVERVARRLEASDPEHPQGGGTKKPPKEQLAVVEEERATLVSAIRAASSASLREQLRVRSFGLVVMVTTVAMTLLAIGVALLGFLSPSTVPACFQPERSGQTVVVCPTAQSVLLDTGQASGPAQPDVDDVVKRTAGPADLFIVELIGLTAAAVSAASAIRGIRGSSEPYALPVALAALKLPTGAITAVLGLLLMRGQFVPGLSALDTSAQILAWALVFGYAQQLFTRLVDQQAHTVLDRVRGADRPEANPA